jgi:hypothetical protein
MAVYHPDATVYSWRGGAYFANDGLGGHIHFGRKSEKLREREISVLDRLTHLQYVAGIFNREEGRLRVRQSQGAPSGHYGALGDIRKQPHGYEYRTLPSWIDNPWLSYFNLVIAKLAVARPEMVPGLTEADGQLTAEQARGQLKMLIAYYAPLDDDARLALHILSRIGFPRANVGTDIKTSWGVYGSGGPLGTKTRSKPSVIPTMIPGMQEDFHSLVDAMVTGGVPEEVPLEPTWTPSELPEGYQCAIDLVDTKQAPGLGEFVSDLCYYSGYKIRIFNLGHGGNMFSLSRDWYEALADSELARSGLSYGVCEERQVTLYINASKDFELPVLMAARERLIHSGVLPLWFITEVTEGSFARWNSPKRRRPKSPPKTSRSTQLYPTKEEF